MKSTVTARNLNTLSSNINNDQDELTSNCSTRKIIEWSYENEDILAEWCDIAQCYKWLNTETYKYYKNVNSYLTIPCIICSTISGSASFGIPNVPQEYQYIIPFITGSITIGVGIITTIQQYYRFSELKETHRILAIAWDKLARNIRIELAKAPAERIDARHFIKFTRIEFDRLMENSEIIPDFIVRKFNENVNDNEKHAYRFFATKTNGDVETEEKEVKLKSFPLKKPDICDTIVSVNTNRRIWFRKENGENGSNGNNSRNGRSGSRDSIFNSTENTYSPKRHNTRKKSNKYTVLANDTIHEDQPISELAEKTSTDFFKTMNDPIYSYTNEYGQHLYWSLSPPEFLQLDIPPPPPPPPPSPPSPQNIPYTYSISNYYERNDQINQYDNSMCLIMDNCPI